MSAGWTRPRSRDARSAALDTISKLRAAGHVALLAGGCVRDMLLGRVPKDYDVVTDATPSRVKQIFPRARQVGAKFGVMLVRKFGHEIEVATFRSDGVYSDGRRPDEVTFGSQDEDAARRDFTINGMFYDPVDDRVIDHVGGRADLEAGVIRTIGVADQRFAEDHLRMLRAVRFAATLTFSIAPETMAAIRAQASKLQLISAERIWQELEQIVTVPTRVRGWSLLIESNLRPYLSEAWSCAPGEDEAVRGRYGLLGPQTVSPALALATALHARTPAQARSVCRALRLSNRLCADVTWVVRALPRVRADHTLELADLKLLRAEAAWNDLMELLQVDLRARGNDVGPYERVANRVLSIAPEAIAPPPLLTGDDLSAMGLAEGPVLGGILKRLYRAQLNEQITTRKQAQALAHRLIEEAARQS